jgi:hypothetical protein
MRFKDFFQSLYESVTFHVDDATENILDIGAMAYSLNRDLYNFLIKNKIKDNNPLHLPQRIDSDGPDFFKKEGIINFYTEGLPEESIPKMISMIKYYIGERNGELTNRVYVETSGVYKSDVWRFHVKIADTNLSNAPELNWSSANARSTLSLLGYSSDHIDEYRPLNARELLMKIEQIEDNDFAISKAIRKTEQNDNVVSFGLSDEQIKEHLNQLKKLAEWAVENHHTYIVLS